jgi:plastocyanin
MSTQARPATSSGNFNRPGEFDFACLIAGHYQAGMVGKITVTALLKPKENT